MLNITHHQGNANQNQNDSISLLFYLMALIKRQEINIGEDVVKREPQCTVSEAVNWCSHYGKQHGVPQGTKTELPYDPAIPLLGIYPKEMKTGYGREICSPIFIAAYS